MKTWICISEPEHNIKVRHSYQCWRMETKGTLAHGMEKRHSFKSGNQIRLILYFSMPSHKERRELKEHGKNIALTYSFMNIQKTWLISNHCVPHSHPPPYVYSCRKKRLEGIFNNYVYDYYFCIFMQILWAIYSNNVSHISTLCRCSECFF